MSPAMEKAVDLLKAGQTYRAAALEAGVSLSGLHYHGRDAAMPPRKRGRSDKSDERSVRAAQLVRDGLTFREAGKRCNISISAVHKAYHKMERQA